MNGEVDCLVGCEKKLSLEEKTLQMLSIFPVYLQASEYEASFESSSRYSREKECI